jgi:hypothetical protein
MIGKRDGATRALKDLAAFLTADVAAVASAVEEKYRLVLIILYVKKHIVKPLTYR